MTPEMTVQEAIERIELLIGSEKLFIKISTMGEISHRQNIEALEMAKQALEKEIEKKPEMYTGYEGKCPCCGAIFLDRSTHNCGNCGQALDWLEEDNNENKD